MAKHLNEYDIERLLDAIDGWEGRLTWDLLSVKLPGLIGRKVSRQSLSANATIKMAFQEKKKKLKEGVQGLSIPNSLTAAAQRIKKLEEENERLKKTNELFYEQFRIWQYNAYKRGVSKEELSQPLLVLN